MKETPIVFKPQYHWKDTGLIVLGFVISPVGVYGIYEAPFAPISWLLLFLFAGTPILMLLNRVSEIELSDTLIIKRFWKTTIVSYKDISKISAYGFKHKKGMIFISSMINKDELYQIISKKLTQKSYCKFNDTNEEEKKIAQVSAVSTLIVLLLVSIYIKFGYYPEGINNHIVTFLVIFVMFAITFPSVFFLSTHLSKILHSSRRSNT